MFYVPASCLPLSAAQLTPRMSCVVHPQQRSGPQLTGEDLLARLDAAEARREKILDDTKAKMGTSSQRRTSQNKKRTEDARLREKQVSYAAPGKWCPESGRSVIGDAVHMTAGTKAGPLRERYNSAKSEEACLHSVL